MQPNDKGICATCPFWQDINGPVSQEAGGGIVPPGVGGACRRLAPQHVYRLNMEMPVHILSTVRPAIWPMTASDDWCGDHPVRAAAAFVRAQSALEAAMPEDAA
jgi:hypothetical protein